MRAWLLGIVLTSLAGGLARQLAPPGRGVCLGFLRYDSGKGVLLIFLIGGGLFAGPEVRQESES